MNLRRVLQISPLRWPMGAQKYLLIGGQGGAATPALAKHLVMCVCVCVTECVSGGVVGERGLVANRIDKVMEEKHTLKVIGHLGGGVVI